MEGEQYGWKELERNRSKKEDVKGYQENRSGEIIQKKWVGMTNVEKELN